MSSFNMTKEEAILIRLWRVETKNDWDATWRSVAASAFREGLCGANWNPANNVLVGRDLCNTAAKFFNENGEEPPWN